MWTVIDLHDAAPELAGLVSERTEQVVTGLARCDAESLHGPSALAGWTRLTSRATCATGPRRWCG
jgi:hypothetical protein